MAKKRYTHKQIRKSIKQNELLNALNRGLAFFRGNTENLLITGIIIAVIAILVPLYFNNKKENERRADTLLNRAIGYTIQPIAEGRTASPEGAFRTAEEKYQKAQKAFAEIVASYRNTRAADQARVNEANAWFYLKEYEKALPLFQDALTRTNQALARATIQGRIGACQENLAQWQAARDTYQGLLSGEAEYFNARAVRLALARCHFQLGEKAEAEKMLLAERDREPGSYWSEIARQQLVIHAGTLK